MPDTDTPVIATWVEFLRKHVGTVDEETFFVAHSIGCQTTLRYLETLPTGQKIGWIVFVAPRLHLNGLETEEEKKIAKPRLEEPIDRILIRQHINNVAAVFSDNDPFVPLDDAAIFEKELMSNNEIQHGKWHFTEEDGVLEIPFVIEQFK